MQGFIGKSLELRTESRWCPRQDLNPAAFATPCALPLKHWGFCVSACYRFAPARTYMRILCQELSGAFALLRPVHGCGGSQWCSLPARRCPSRRKSAGAEPNPRPTPRASDPLGGFASVERLPLALSVRTVGIVDAIAGLSVALNLGDLHGRVPGWGWVPALPSGAFWHPEKG